MKLSVLICNTDTRVSTFLPKIVKELCRQAEGKDVEVLWLGDNKKRTVGAKRNALIDLAKGEYFSFVDDDDRVSEDYIDVILYGIEKKPTVFCFHAYRHHNGFKDREVKYGLQYEYDQNKVDAYYRIPNHLMVWHRETVKGIRFEEINYGEDSDWAVRVKNSGLITKQSNTKRILYHYDFNEKTTETQQGFVSSRNRPG